MTSTAPTFFATPETAAEVADAPAVAVLIGGYDGSGNYGDIALLDAALGLLDRLDPDVLLLPVVERSYLADHRALSGDFLHPPKRALFFDAGEGHEDDLVAVPAPVDLAFGACYLYGGGYLNPSWGKRKLAMLGAAESLLAIGGAKDVCRLSSGLQVDGGWTGGVAAAEAEALHSFELLGVRDRGSGEALAALHSPAPIVDTGDDALGILRRLPPADPPAASDESLHVNLHIAEHEWVTERPGGLADLYADFVAELGRRAGRPVVAHPLVAYVDRRVGEHAALERLAGACAARGVALVEPLVLRPAGLVAASTELRRSRLTVSCSFHVALTSLLLEVPAILIRDNAYYAQKATGLTETFGLPRTFGLDSTVDPLAAARDIATVVLDEKESALLRRRLSAAAGRVRERRADVEVELLSRLGGAATAALTTRVAEVAERLRERSREPAELLTRLSLLQSENGEPPAPSAAAGAGSEGVAEVTLAKVLGSRSWRMTAPLRRLGARLRRR